MSNKTAEQVVSKVIADSREVTWAHCLGRDIVSALRSAGWLREANEIPALVALEGYKSALCASEKDIVRLTRERDKARKGREHQVEETCGGCSACTKLDLPAILAALTEAEDLREDFDKLIRFAESMGIHGSESCSEAFTTMTHRWEDARDGLAAGQAREVALRAFGERCVIETLRYMQDSWDDFSAEEWLAAMCSPNHTDSGIIVDRVLGGS